MKRRRLGPQRRKIGFTANRTLLVTLLLLLLQQVQQFFELIFHAVRDVKPLIRETAVEALRAALIVTAQRETTKQTHRPVWYKQCYDEAKIGLEDSFIREKVYLLVVYTR